MLGLKVAGLSITRPAAGNATVLPRLLCKTATTVPAATPTASLLLLSSSELNNCLSSEAQPLSCFSTTRGGRLVQTMA